MNVFNVQYKTVATTTWKRDTIIVEQSNEGWDYVRENRVTARKVAIIFSKLVPRPLDPDAAIKRQLAENLTESNDQ